MNKTRVVWIVGILAVVGVSMACLPVKFAASGNNSPEMDQLVLPEGFTIEVFAENVKNARSLALGDNGTIFVGTRREGSVYALVDTDNDGTADKQYLIDQDLFMPNGVAFRNGSLYVAEVNRVLRYDNIESKLSNPGEPVVVTEAYPDDSHHGWKYIAFGPDDKLYIPVGAPCNICESENEVYNTITRIDPDGSNMEIVATGVRNSVGFDWNPETGELWFTENGRDWLGEDSPADELNRVTTVGEHFGYPYCHQGDMLDPEFGKGRTCTEFTAPVQNLHPHGAALGMEFYTGNAFPAEFKNKILICEHGSWNRSEPIGYEITMVTMDGNKAVAYESFVSGWLQGKEAWGRPVDILEMPDGSLLVSDDTADMIYRIKYTAE